MRKWTVLGSSIEEEAAQSLELGTVQVLRILSPQGVNRIRQPRESFWVDYALSPRPAGASAAFDDSDKSTSLRPLGEVFVFPPLDPIRVWSGAHEEAQSSLVCELNPDAIAQWLGGELTRADHESRATFTVQGGALRRILQHMALELRSPGLGSDVMLELLCGQVALELSRYYVQQREPQSRGGLAPWRLRAIDERLRDNAEAPSLAELARICKLSVRQLSRGFRASRGFSLGQHIVAARMEHAKHYLRQDLSVKDVAETLGFASPSSFCHAFRTVVGATPTQYRRKMMPKG